MLMQPMRSPVVAAESSAAAAIEPAAIVFDDVSLFFGGDSEAVHALDHVSISAKRGEITSVVGPSGCGKTTLLRLAAGLLKPSGGHVVYNEREIKGLNTGVGFVTQDSNLFPWATTVANIEFPLAVRGVAQRKRRARAMEWIDTVGLAGFEHSFPSQLSGGMQKRASIARTFIYEPDVILLDEPFGALDAQTRMMLHHQLLALWHKRKMTMLFITHDLVEAITLSDQVVVMSKRPGRVQASYRIPLARPRNVFEIYLEPGFDAAYGALWKHFKAELATDKVRPMPAAERQG
jgi:ABC-type nitrate/sulfonate/bicarbonate transport system ATPase subunit